MADHAVANVLAYRLCVNMLKITRGRALRQAYSVEVINNPAAEEYLPGILACWSKD